MIITEAGLVIESVPCGGLMECVYSATKVGIQSLCPLLMSFYSCSQCPWGLTGIHTRVMVCGCIYIHNCLCVCTQKVIFFLLGHFGRLGSLVKSLGLFLSRHPIYPPTPIPQHTLNWPENQLQHTHTHRLALNTYLVISRTLES